LLVTALMVVWLLVTSGLAGLSSSGALSEQAPVDLGRGVTVTPAPGWAPAGAVWDVGPGAVSFKRSGALAAFAAEQYPGDSEDLLERELDSLREELGSFRGLPAGDRTIGDGVPARSVLFSGTSESTRLEGELVTAVVGDTAVLMLAVAPFGQLSRVQADLDAMLAGLTLPR
jgi:hypothetical protein